MSKTKNESQDETTEAPKVAVFYPRTGETILQ